MKCEPLETKRFGSVCQCSCRCVVRECVERGIFAGIGVFTRLEGHGVVSSFTYSNQRFNLMNDTWLVSKLHDGFWNWQLQAQTISNVSFVHLMNVGQQQSLQSEVSNEFQSRQREWELSFLWCRKNKLHKMNDRISNKEDHKITSEKSSRFVKCCWRAAQPTTATASKVFVTRVTCAKFVLGIEQNFRPCACKCPFFEFAHFLHSFEGLSMLTICIHYWPTEEAQYPERRTCGAKTCSYLA